MFLKNDWEFSGRDINVVLPRIPLPDNLLFMNPKSAKSRIVNQNHVWLIGFIEFFKYPHCFAAL